MFDVQSDGRIKSQVSLPHLPLISLFSLIVCQCVIERPQRPGSTTAAGQLDRGATADTSTSHLFALAGRKSLMPALRIESETRQSADLDDRRFAPSSGYRQERLGSCR